MNDPRREAPPGLHVPAHSQQEGMSGPAWWVFLAAMASPLAGVGIGLWLDDWYLAGAVAGSAYALIVLTIIALKA